MNYFTHTLIIFASIYGALWLGEFFVKRLWSSHARIRQAGYALERTRDELHLMLRVVEKQEDAPPFRHYVEDETFVWFVHREHDSILDEIHRKMPTEKDMLEHAELVVSYAEALIVFFDVKEDMTDPHADIFGGVQ